MPLLISLFILNLILMVAFLFQIRHMIAFIDQEAIEKCEEIDAKV